MDQALKNLGLTSAELLTRMIPDAVAAGTEKLQQAPTLWSEPPLVVCGTPNAVIQVFREFRAYKPANTPEKENTA